MRRGVAPFTSAGNPGQFYNTALAIDQSGDIWVTGFAGYNGSSVVDVSSGMLAEFSNLGAPLTQPSKINSGATTYGGYIPAKNTQGNAGTIAAHSIAFDPSGNAWVLGGYSEAEINGQTPGALTEVSPTETTVSSDVTDIQVGSIEPAPVVIDGGGIVWAVGTTNDGEDLFEYNGTILTHDHGVNSTDGTNYYSLQALTFDSNAAFLWASDPGYSDLYRIDPTGNTNVADYYESSPYGTYTPLVAGPADPNTGNNPGNVYGCADAGSQTLDAFKSSVPTPTPTYSILVQFHDILYTLFR